LDERIRVEDCLAVDGVSREPLSRPEFPANREIYKEFCEFGLIISGRRSVYYLEYRPLLTDEPHFEGAT
jgi:hypothetical protein